MNDTKIILIDGNQRSGTNLLLHLLDGHPQLRVLPEETVLYSEFYSPENASQLRLICKERDFEKFKDATKDWWFFRSYTDFAKKGLIPPPKGTFGKDYEFKFSMEDFYERLNASLAKVDLWTVEIILREILESFWEVWMDRKRDGLPIVAKNHEAGLWLSDIIKENPDIRFIHMVRNPLDVISSQKERYRRVGKWGFKHLAKEVQKYDILKRNIRDNKNLVLTVRYEDIVNKREHSLREVCNFLNITFNTAVFRRFTIGKKPWYSNTSYDPNRFGNIEEKRHILRYRQTHALSIREYNFVLKRLMDHIEYWGYDTDCISTLRYGINKLFFTNKIAYYKNKFFNFLYRPIKKKKKLYHIKLKVPSYINRHVGKDFLVLASGKSIYDQREDIYKFIEKYKPILITANNMAWFTVPHYHSFFNRRRFCMYAHTIHKESRIVLSPYLPKYIIKRHYKEKYEESMFRNEDNKTFYIVDGIISSNCRSSCLLNIGISIVMGARNIYVAGLDGFIDVYDSPKYYFSDEPATCTYDELRDIQGRYISLIQEYLKNINKNPFYILTKTYFNDWYKDVNTFL